MKEEARISSILPAKSRCRGGSGRTSARHKCWGRGARQVFRLGSLSPAFPFPVALYGARFMSLTAAGPLPHFTGFPFQAGQPGYHCRAYCRRGRQTCQCGAVIRKQQAFAIRLSCLTRHLLETLFARSARGTTQPLQQDTTKGLSTICQFF